MADEQIYSPALGKFGKQHFDLAVKHFTHDLDDQTSILKAHLLLEGMFRDFCSRSLPNPQHLQGARLTFKQILLLARSLDTDYSDMPLWSVVSHLNSLRNAMAHELEPSAEKIAKLQRMITTATAALDDERDSHSLQDALAFVCGFMSQHLELTLDADGISEQDGSVTK